MSPINESWAILKRTNWLDWENRLNREAIDPDKPWMGWKPKPLHHVKPLNAEHLDFALGRGIHSDWRNYHNWSPSKRSSWARDKVSAHDAAHESYREPDTKNPLTNETVLGGIVHYPPDHHIKNPEAHAHLTAPVKMKDGKHVGGKGYTHIPTSDENRDWGIQELNRIQEEEANYERVHDEARDATPHWKPQWSKIKRVDEKEENTKRLKKVRKKLEGILSGDLVPREAFNEELGTSITDHQNVSMEERGSDEWKDQYGVNKDGIAHKRETILGSQVLQHLHNLGLDAGRVRGNIYINLDGHHFVMPAWTNKGLGRTLDSNPYNARNRMSESDRLQAIDPEAAAHVDFLQGYWRRRDKFQAGRAGETEVAPESYFWDRLKNFGGKDWMNMANASIQDFDRLRVMLRETLPLTRLFSHGERGGTTFQPSMREMDEKDWGKGKGPGTFYYPHDRSVPSPIEPIRSLGERGGKGPFRRFKPPPEAEDPRGVAEQPSVVESQAEEAERSLTGLPPTNKSDSLKPKHLFGAILSVANEDGSVTPFNEAWRLLKEGESMTAAQWKGGEAGNGFRADSSNDAQKPEKTSEEKQAEVMATHNSTVNNPATQEWFQILLPPSIKYRQELLEGMDKAGVAIHSENHKKDVKPMEDAFKSVHKLIMNMRAYDSDTTGEGTGEGPPSLLGDDSSGISQFEQAYAGGGDD